MARGRMVNQSISDSKKYNNLPDDTCRLLATWTIPHLDKNGVFHAEPTLVRSKVFPWRDDLPVKKIATYLDAMEEVGLIMRFEANGHLWQVWPGFADNQPGLHADRERTTYPEPPEPCGVLPEKRGENPVTAGENPASSGLTEVNPSEVELKRNGNGVACATIAPPLGSSFAEWAAKLQASKNRPAVLHEAFVSLYPDRDPPDFGYLGRTARTVGGAGRLLELLWQNSTRPPTGDILAYCMGCNKRGQSTEPKSFPALRALAEEQGWTQEEATCQT